MIFFLEFCLFLIEGPMEEARNKTVRFYPSLPSKIISESGFPNLMYSLMGFGFFTFDLIFVQSIYILLRFKI